MQSCLPFLTTFSCTHHQTAGQIAKWNDRPPFPCTSDRQILQSQCSAQVLLRSLFATTCITGETVSNMGLLLSFSNISPKGHFLLIHQSPWRDEVNNVAVLTSFTACCWALGVTSAMLIVPKRSNMSSMLHVCPAAINTLVAHNSPPPFATWNLPAASVRIRVSPFGKSKSLMSFSDKRSRAFSWGKLPHAWRFQSYAFQTHSLQTT